MNREPQRMPRAPGESRRRLRARGGLVRAAPRVGEEADDPVESAIELLLAASPLPLLLFDVADQRVIDAGGGLEALLGYSREELRGRLPSELPMFDGPASAEVLRLLVNHAPLTDRDWTLRRHDGGRAHVIAAGRVVELDGARAALLLLTDYTERRQWLEANARAREDFVNIFMHSPQPLCIAEVASERLLYVSDAWQKLYGYGALEACGRTVGELDIWEVDSERRRVLRQLGESGACENVEARHRCRDGSVIDVLLTGQLKSLDGHSVQVWQAMDISERRRYERAAERLNEELEKRVADRTGELRSANEELEAFSYSVAHDLRAPLRAIDGFARLLAREHGGELSDEAAAYLARITGNAERMAKLIDDLLAFARLGRREFGWGRVDMGRVAAEVAEALLADDPRAHITVAALPEATGDPAMLRQVFENLLSNALKFSNHETLPRVEVGCIEGESADTWFVRDNGVGFDMRHAARLFGVFERLHGAREYPGTGLGLAIVQRIIQRHRGRVWAEAAPGQGATFYFELPHAGVETAV